MGERGGGMSHESLCDARTFRCKLTGRRMIRGEITAIASFVFTYSPVAGKREGLYGAGGQGGSGGGRTTDAVF